MNVEDPRDKRIRELEALLEQALVRIGELESQVAKLQQQLAKNSRNSSKPPSSDGPQKPNAKPKPKSLRKKGQRPSGGQSGHRGETLKRSKRIDRTEKIAAPKRCSCGVSLEDIEGVVGEARQVHDIPPIKIEVTEYRLEEKSCPCCQTVNRGVFPEHVRASVCYGPRLQAIATYCRTYQLLPSARTCELIEDVYGLRISEGTLANILSNADEIVAPSVEATAEALKQAELAHADETGLRIEGKRHWLHVVSNKELTYYAVHKKRGSEAMDSIGIIPAFRGRLMHDHWHPYFNYTECCHSLCNTHHLRDLTFVHEELGKAWAKRMNTCLLDMNRAVMAAKALGRTRLAGGTLKTLLRRYDEIIQDGYTEEPSPKPSPKKKRGKPKKGKSYGLLDRFDKKRDQILPFLTDFKVPFGNNLGEQDIRMVKTQQKISGTFRSWLGATQFCNIRSYISTARKQGARALQVLSDAFMGTPFMPVASFET